MSFIQISYAFQQCKSFDNQLTFDKVTENFKVGTFFETQCINNQLTFYSDFQFLTYFLSVM